MTSVQQLMDWVASLDADYKRTNPFPADMEVEPHKMAMLIDHGVIGMDGFRYCFVEYARDCWVRCGHHV
jgi:hypothetical protein